MISLKTPTKREMEIASDTISSMVIKTPKKGLLRKRTLSHPECSIYFAQALSDYKKELAKVAYDEYTGGNWSSHYNNASIGIAKAIETYGEKE